MTAHPAEPVKPLMNSRRASHEAMYSELWLSSDGTTEKDTHVSDDTSLLARLADTEAKCTANPYHKSAHCALSLKLSAERACGLCLFWP
jgi:hypothetical protein